MFQQALEKQLALFVMESNPAKSLGSVCLNICIASNFCPVHAASFCTNNSTVKACNLSPFCFRESLLRVSGSRPGHMAAPSHAGERAEHGADNRHCSKARLHGHTAPAAASTASTSRRPHTSQHDRSRSRGRHAPLGRPCCSENTPRRSLLPASWKDEEDSLPRAELREAAACLPWILILEPRVQRTKSERPPPTTSRGLGLRGRGQLPLQLRRKCRRAGGQEWQMQRGAGGRAWGICFTSTHIPARSHSASRGFLHFFFFFTSSKSPAYDLLLNR